MKIKIGHLITFLTLLSSCHVYDIVIQNGYIYDGSGGPAYKADVAIEEERIVRIDSSISQRSKHEIDATNLAVAPGFIDLHAHLSPITLYPAGSSAIMQGVTTALGGPDGGSPFPLRSYLDELQQKQLGLNVAYLIGHNTIRNHVMGPVDRTPSEQELEKMKALIEEAMLDGAFGMSTGLKYVPGSFADVEEIVALANIAAKYDGIYTSHLRDEGTELVEAVEEAIDIGRRAAIPVILTHHKVMGASNWGSSTQTLAMIDAANERGIQVSADQYPYTASHTSLRVVIPAWAFSHNDGNTFSSRCEDPTLRDSIRSGIINNLFNDRGGSDLSRIQFAKIEWKPSFVGKTLQDLLISEGIEPTLENAAEMIIDIQLHRGAMCIYHVMDQKDVDRIMQHEATMIASDGTISKIGSGHPHPRSYGTFPRVLGHYVRERAILDLPTAIRKMTDQPARALELTDRGQIRTGYWADITIFDPSTIKDLATFKEPHAYPEGIEYVIVNGTIVVNRGQLQDARGGKILRKIKAIHMN
ncbi:MAG: D-aminoacylase [Saprospiraceae bacterium]|nr:D-aminoacylase [Saprospiraceae bacterium]